MNKKDKKRLQMSLCVGLAIALALCLFQMPYGYFQLVRFMALVIFAYLAFLEYKAQNIDRMVLFIALAILFQPFAKIALGRMIWNIVDVAVTIYLLYLSIKVYKN